MQESIQNNLVLLVVNWISMKLETKYLGMSKLFEYPNKSYLKNLTWCEMPQNLLQHIGLLHIGTPKQCLLPSIVFVTH